jgi:hypothetical protein
MSFELNAAYLVACLVVVIGLRDRRVRLPWQREADLRLHLFPVAVTAVAVKPRA